MDFIQMNLKNQLQQDHLTLYEIVIINGWKPSLFVL